MKCRGISGGIPKGRARKEVEGDDPNCEPENEFRTGN
jgi:hypothetical protein